MQIVQVQVFSLSELSQKAKDKAYCDWLKNLGYYFNRDEVAKVLHKFGELFYLHPRAFYYEYGSTSSYPHCHFSQNDWFEQDFDMWEMSGLRLHRWIVNNIFPKLEKSKIYNKARFSTIDRCVRFSKVQKEISRTLTGSQFDEDILKPLLDFVRKPSKEMTMAGLVSDCLKAWVKSANDEYESATSFETFEHDCQETEALFFDDGKLHSW